jgi:crotonobetainyl-CoA:carnitine CoA-transferase CaiB-like acyl-CoA transferase
MGLDEPVIPPFPISDYGTGCMGAIAALTGLYHRSTTGGSWHGKVSLMQYDLLLFRVGMYDKSIQAKLRKTLDKDFLALRHHDSVDQISGRALKMMRKQHPELFENKDYTETWFSQAYDADVTVLKPVAEIEGLKMGFQRASRPNGSDKAAWSLGKEEGDFERKEL